MSKKFGRRAEVSFADKVIKYPDLDMELEVEFDTNSDGNTANLKVYNLSDKTINKLKKDTVTTIRAGYKEDVGLLIQGIIASSKSKFENNHKVTEVAINDNTKAWVKDTHVNLTWSEETKAKKIVKVILDKLPLALGDFDVAKNLSYPAGKTLSKNARRALEEIAKDTNSKLHISNGKVYFRPEAKPNRETLRLNKDTGLIASPQKLSEDRWKVQSLLNYKIQADNILDIKSLTLNGRYRVKSGKHILSNFNTEVEVVKV